MTGYDEKRDLFIRAWAITPGGTLPANGCLPISMAALAITQQTYPAAYVVVGEVQLNGSGNSLGNGAEIHAFLNDQKSRVPSFHAWIDLGNNDIADITISSTWAGKVPPEYTSIAIDMADAKQIGLIYTPVLTDPEDVKAFHNAVMHPDAPGQSRDPLPVTTVQGESKPDTQISRIWASLKSLFR